MNLSAPFITRPVATTLLSLSVVLVGVLGYILLPVSPLPQIDFPAISVSASLPGASPETMASSVATPLERALGTIAGVNEISSQSSQGSTRINIQFDLDKNIDSAAREVQAAINASRSLLPSALPGMPSYRKINPSQAPIMRRRSESPRAQRRLADGEGTPGDDDASRAGCRRVRCDDECRLAGADAAGRCDTDPFDVGIRAPGAARSGCHRCRHGSSWATHGLRRRRDAVAAAARLSDGEWPSSDGDRRRPRRRIVGGGRDLNVSASAAARAARDADPGDSARCRPCAPRSGFDLDARGRRLRGDGDACRRNHVRAPERLRYRNRASSNEEASRSPGSIAGSHAEHHHSRTAADRTSRDRDPWRLRLRSPRAACGSGDRDLSLSARRVEGEGIHADRRVAAGALIDLDVLSRDRDIRCARWSADRINMERHRAIPTS